MTPHKEPDAKETKAKELELKAKYDKLKTTQDEKWQREIEALERRVVTNFVDIDIGDGDTIAIRANISDAEAGNIAKLDKERQKLDPEKDEDKLNEISWEILGIVTANPLFTKEWFRDNREWYSTEDMLKVILGYYDQMAKRVERLSELQSFRKK